MAGVEVEELEDDRETSLPSSALSPSEYRAFRGMLNELHQKQTRPDLVEAEFVLNFLETFKDVAREDAEKVPEHDPINACTQLIE